MDTKLPITLTLREIYGRMLAYPTCETSKGLVSLLGRKTFTMPQVKHLQSLGYIITLVQPSLDSEEEDNDPLAP